MLNIADRLAYPFTSFSTQDYQHEMHRLVATGNGDDLIQLGANDQNLSLSSEITQQVGKLTQQTVALTAELKASKALITVLQEQNDALQKQNHAAKLNEQRLIAELSQLRQEIALVKRNGSELEAATLTEESDELRRKLDEMVSKCQELAHRLTNSKTPAKLANDEKSGIDLEKQSKADSEIGTLLTQVSRMETELFEVNAANRQWEERYMKQRQQMEQLKSELKKRSSGQAVQSSSSFHRRDDDEHRQQVEQLMDMYKHKLAQLETHLKQIDAENVQLKTQLEELQQQHQLVSGRQNTREGESIASIEPQQQLELLWHQAQLYLEDFQSERRDRERAQSQIATLENEIQVLRSRVEEEQVNHSRRHLLHMQSYSQDECDGLATRYRSRGPLNQNGL